MTRDEKVKTEVAALARDCGVRYRLTRDWAYMGSCCPIKKIVTLNLDCTYVEILSTFFHEVGHVEARKKGKFKVYHSVAEFRSRKERMIFNRTALRAELWVEDWAEKEFLKRFPKKKYSRTYGYDDESKLAVNKECQIGIFA